MEVLIFFLLFSFFLPFFGYFIISSFGVSFYNRERIHYLISFAIGFVVIIKALTIGAYFNLLHTYFDLFLFGLLILIPIVIDLLFNKGSILTRYLSTSFQFITRLPVAAMVYFRENKPLSIVLISLLTVLLIISFTPVRHADVLRYHLEYSNFILDTASLPFVPHNQLALAADAELFFSFIKKWLGVSYIKPVIVFFYVLSVVAVSNLLLIVTNRNYSVGILVFVLSPAVFISASIVKPDIFQLYLFTLVLYLSYYIYKSNSYPLLIFILIGVFAGEVIALKWTGLLPIFSFSAFILFLLLHDYFTYKKRFKTYFKILIAILFGVVLMPLYFYIRNFSFTGNPLWPLLSNLFPSFYSADSLMSYVSSFPSSRASWINTYGFFGYLFFTFFIYLPSVLGGIGVSNYLFLFNFKLFYRDLVFRLSFFYILLYVVIWFSIQASFRHLIWIIPFLSILSVLSLNQFQIFGRYYAYIFKPLFLCLLAFQLVFILFYSSFFLKFSIGLISDNDYYKTTPYYDIYKQIDNDLSSFSKMYNVKVLSIVPSSELYYFPYNHVDGNISHSAIVDYESFDNSRDLLCSFLNSDFTHILFDEELLINHRYSNLRGIIDSFGTLKTYYGLTLVNRLLDKYRPVKLNLLDLSVIHNVSC